MIEDRQRKSGGLAGSGLRNADDVPGRQHLRNGLRLDRCRGCVLLVSDGTGDWLCEPKVEKSRQCKIFLAAIRACQGVWHTTANRGGNGTPRVAWAVSELLLDTGVEHRKSGIRSRNPYTF